MKLSQNLPYRATMKEWNIGSAAHYLPEVVVNWLRISIPEQDCQYNRNTTMKSAMYYRWKFAKATLLLEHGGISRSPSLW